jgi:hypothetical protein
MLADEVTLQSERGAAKSRTEVLDKLKLGYTGYGDVCLSAHESTSHHHKCPCLHGCSVQNRPPVCSTRTGAEPAGPEPSI